MNSVDRPGLWEVETLEKKWVEHLQHLAEDKAKGMSFKRIRYQAEQEAQFQEVRQRWSELTGEQRQITWDQLLEVSEKSTAEMLPMCVRCGTCCVEGSPTLYEEDLEILREEKIPWDQLVTLRKGEPARSPFTGEVFYLPEELVKIREKPGTHCCVFFDETDSSCTIHIDRPVQCRAQACWDETDFREQAASPRLTRQHIVNGAETLVPLLEEHEQRCSFEKLRKAFDKLKESEGRDAGEVIEVLAFDDHFRGFLEENLKVPRGTLDLICGRSLIERTRLFGFRVEISPDGTRTLLPSS